MNYTVLTFVLLVTLQLACAKTKMPAKKATFADGWYEVKERPSKVGRAFEMRIHIPELEAVRQNSSTEEAFHVRKEADYYYNFGIQRDIYLVQGQDSIRPSVIHVEADAGIRPWRTVLMEFDAASSYGEAITLTGPLTKGKVAQAMLWRRKQKAPFEAACRTMLSWFNPQTGHSNCSKDNNSWKGVLECFTISWMHDIKLLSEKLKVCLTGIDCHISIAQCSSLCALQNQWHPSSCHALSNLPEKQYAVCVL